MTGLSLFVQSPEKLGQHYEKMAAKFEAGGLDLSAVRDAG